MPRKPAPMQIEVIALDALTPFERNARTHSDAQVAQIAASIEEFSFLNPVLVDAEGGIVAGHGRVLAARRLGMTEVPCVRLAHLTPAQRRAYVLADNQLALNAGWDDELLRLELGALDGEGFDLGVIGFDDDELAALMGEGGRASAAEPADEGIAREERFDVLVTCADEAERTAAFHELQAQGYAVSLQPD